jgi:hypothetical protein
MVRWGVEQAPRLTEDLLGQQEAALRELLRQFREGNLEEALRRALPLNAPAGRGGTVATGAALPSRDPRWDLRDLLASGRGPTAAWLGGGDVQAELTREYRKAAEAAAARGDFRRAAFIWGRLLHDYHQAAAVLARGGLHHDAALVYLELLGDLLAAAREFEAAGEVDRALGLYRKRGDHLAAGDLLRRAGEDERALEEYREAAAEYAARGNHLEAGNVLRDRARRADLALEYYLAGWAGRPHGSAVGCLMHLLEARAAEESPAALLALVDEADGFFGPPGHEAAAIQFGNAVAELAGREHLARVADELRDRARRGLAGKMRQRAALETRPGFAASEFFGRAGSWHPAVVSDAAFAFRRAVRHEPVPRRQTGPRLRLASGRVTAVCAAGHTGRVFAGFAGGAWVMFDPGDGSVHHPPTPPGAPATVTCLATNPEGDRLVALHAPGGTGRRGLESYRLAGAGFSRLRRVELPPVEGDVWLTPVAEEDGKPAVGLWDGEGLAVLAASDLVRVETITPPEDGTPEEPLGAFLFRGLSPRAAAVGLMVGRSRVWFFGETPEHESAPWCPIALGWAVRDAGCYPPPSLPRVILKRRSEVVGAADRGPVFWQSGSPERILTLGEERASTRETGYLLAAFLYSRRVAGVKPGRVDWLRREGPVLKPWSSTAADLADAVFAAFSPPTSELLVVCRDGDLVRVPVPPG